MSNSTIPDFFASCRTGVPNEPKRPEMVLDRSVEQATADEAVYTLLRSLPPRYAKVLAAFWGLPYQVELRKDVPHPGSISRITEADHVRPPTLIKNLGKVTGIGQQSAVLIMHKTRELMKNTAHPHRQPYNQLRRGIILEPNDAFPYTATSHWGTVPLSQTVLGGKERMLSTLEKIGLYTVADLLDTHQINKLVIEGRISQEHLRIIQKLLIGFGIPEYAVPFYFRAKRLDRKHALTNIKYYREKAADPLERANAEQHELRYLDRSRMENPPEMSSVELDRIVRSPWYIRKLRRLAEVNPDTPMNPDSCHPAVVKRAVQDLLRTLPTRLAAAISAYYGIGFVEKQEDDGLITFDPDPRAMCANGMTCNQVGHFYGLGNNAARVSQFLESAKDSIRNRKDHPLRRQFWNIVEGTQIHGTQMPSHIFDGIAVAELPSVRADVRVANALDRHGIYTVTDALRCSIEDFDGDNSIGSLAISKILEDLQYLTLEHESQEILTGMSAVTSNLASKLIVLNKYPGIPRGRLREEEELTADGTEMSSQL